MTSDRQSTPLVLIADDDRTTRLILKMLLKKEGYEVIEAEDGTQCLSAFSQHKPQMVLLDAQMPVMDGFESCTALKKLPSGDRTPVLMITGLDDPQSVDRAFQAGATDFVTKPIHPPVLSRRLHYLLEASRIETALRDSEEKYRSLVNNLKEVIFQTDLEGNFTFLNPAWEKVTGFLVNKSICKNIFDFILPKNEENFKEKFFKLLDGKGSDFRSETRFSKKDKGIGWINIYISPLISCDGSIIGSTGSFTDITELKDRQFIEKLERNISKTLATSATIEDPLSELLKTVGNLMEWEYGEFWSINKITNEFECLQTWKNISSVQDIDFSSNQELIKKLWDNSGLNSLSSTKYSQNIYQSVCESFTVQSIFSFPILGDFEQLGMVVFFKKAYLKIETNLLNNLKLIGRQIGAFILRKQAEEDLKKQHSLMRTELDQASEYIRTQLPAQLDDKIKINHIFVPSQDLGGDIFDYFWLDDNHLVVYLLDVAGHGVKSALRSISALNVIRSQSLQDTNFYQPASVLRELNRVFPMGVNGDDYFTIWYGVYDHKNRKLNYSSAGHPSALLFTSDNKVTKLNAGGIPIGMLSNINYLQELCFIEDGSHLYLFSDGVYEIIKNDGTVWDFDSFIDLVKKNRTQNIYHLEEIFKQIMQLKNSPSLDDDFSILNLKF